MKLLLLAGYRQPLKSELALGISAHSQEASVLSKQIKKISSLGFELVVVLAGPQSEVQLRKCLELADCELAFDTSPKPNLFTNLRGGLATTEEASLVLPVDIELTDKKVTDFLIREHAREGARTPFSIIQATDSQGAPWQMGFPLLVTRNGNKLIQDTEDMVMVTDPRVLFLRHPYQDLATPLESL